MSDAAGTGRAVGRYHLHRELAKGGMARIHLARAIGDEGFSRIVAAKRINPELASDPELVAMFLDEARVASKVRHRNVVAVLDVVTVDGELVIVQELVHGVPLHKLFVRAVQSAQYIPAAIAVAIATQVLSGLHAAHETTDETGAPLDIIHRDVSPQNIMIADDGTVRLLDFGVAKAAASAASHVTRAGTFKGKVPYSAPEQLLGQAARQTDIYALGIVLWELLVGHRMHGGLSDAEIHKRVLDGTATPITAALARQRSDGRIDDAEWQRLVALEPIVARALAREVGERYATAAAMERALLDVLRPVPPAELAAWMRELAPDILLATERLIAEEEVGWRLARGSGCGPTVKREVMPPPVRADGSAPIQRTRLPSTIGTEPAKPSAMVVAKQTRELAILAEQRLHTSGLLAEALGILAVLLFWIVAASRSSPVPPPAALAAPAHPALAPLQPAAAQAPTTQTPVTSPTRAPSATASATMTNLEHPVVRRPPRRALAKQRSLAPAKPATSCATPFYYVGTKKVFKPSCI